MNKLTEWIDWTELYDKMRTRLPRCRRFLSIRCLVVTIILVALGMICYEFVLYNQRPTTNTGVQFYLGLHKTGTTRWDVEAEPQEITIDAAWSQYMELSPSSFAALSTISMSTVLRSRQSVNTTTTLKPTTPPGRRRRKVLVNKNQCSLKESSADIDTVAIYQSFDFEPSWMWTNEFWDKSFEDRYKKTKKDPRRPTLKVFVVPHSHNDPGWLLTFEQYFKVKTMDILDNVVRKLDQYPNMTFVWTEISFLNEWWQRSRTVRKQAMKNLIKEGRLEITTGGWVMPDEACTHIYALIDQFIEGHTWVKNNLGVIPKTGWSIDPFGHGPTVPYLLDQSGLEGAIIQRIHYAWKQWLAKQQINEFYWIPGWSTKRPDLVVHSRPFHLYGIEHTCGPHPYVCLYYDFAKKHRGINNKNLHSKSEKLIEEYMRIGSLTPHNVVLVPLGNDFRYDQGYEFQAQYTNYMKIFNYINSHKDQFNAEVQFGTPLDYFNAVKERYNKIPTLKGDFFVYSDINQFHRPDYWSGYFTTRPYFKILARQLEHQLRTSEILFTLVVNYIKQSSKQGLASQKRLETHYEQLIIARRNLGLFQHHDAITGTATADVMFDYGTKLFTSLYHCIQLQETALATIMLPDNTINRQNIIKSEIDWVHYGKPVKFKLQVSLINRKAIILYNPLAVHRTEVITVTSGTANIRVYDTRQREYVPYQVTPNIDVREDGKRVISETNYEILFVATLPPLSSVTFNLEKHTNRSHHCEVFCLNCQNEQVMGDPLFLTKKLLPNDIQLENSALTLFIDRNTGFLRQIYRKDVKIKNVVKMQIGAYQSAQGRSGAYLFMPDYMNLEKNVLLPYSKWNQSDDNIMIVSGPISTDITTMYLPFLIHTVRIYHVEDPILSRGVFFENIVNFEDPPKNQDTELFIRIQTDIQNGEPPEFFTDQNGYQYQKRVKIDKLGIESNYYPITTMAWLQDEETRMTLITNHAQGASAFQPGLLEVMLDRRTLYDDFRGVGEGVVDNKPTVFQNWLLLESMTESRPKRDTSEKGFKHVSERHFNPNQKDSLYALPSQMADHMSRAMNYPVNVYLVDTSEVGEVQLRSHQTLVQHFPAGVHLLTLRTITDEALEQSPSAQSYMVLQRPGTDCRVGPALNRSAAFSARTQFTGLRIRNLTAVSLTGLKTYESLDGLHSIQLEQMEVKTFKIRF